MMKIAINGRFLGRQVTGVERVALETMRALHAMVDQHASGTEHLHVTVLLPQGTPAPTGFDRFTFRHIGRYQGHAWEQFSLPNALEPGQVLVSLCNTSSLWVKRQVVLIHDAATVDAPSGYSWSFRTWYRIMIRTLMMRARVVATVSKFSRDQLLHHFGPRSAGIAVVSEGVDHITRASADDAVLDRFELRTRPFVLAVSSQQPNKNFGLLVDAVGKLASPPFDVVIAGGSGHAAFASRQVAQPAFVKNLGYVSDAELVSLYRHAACFVFPSLYEGFGLPPVEAMASGCPVIASSAASLPEVCGEAARYISPHDSGGLLACLQTVMSDDDERARMRGAGLAHVKNMTWHNTAQQLIKLASEAVA